MITVKEEFLADAKTKLAIRLGGSEAVHMWLALKAHAASKLTDGFIPDVIIDDLPGAPRNPRKALKALVDCGMPKPDGTKGSGLVDEVPNGWQLHDYLDHANSSTEELQRREKERARKAAYRAGRTGRVPRDNGGTTGGTSAGTDDGTTDGTSNGTTGRVPRPVPRDIARAPGVRPRAPASPAQPSPAHDPEGGGDLDLTGQSGPEPANRPLPRRTPLLAQRVLASAYEPLAEHRAYAIALGLTPERYDDALRDLRDKHGGRPHDEPWLDDKFCSFLEQEAKPKPSQRGAQGPRPVAWQPPDAGVTGFEGTELEEEARAATR